MMTGMGTPLERESPLRGRALRQAVWEVVGRHLDLGRFQVFLFGSETQGKARPGSDIDVGVLGPEPVPGPVLERIREDLDTLRTLRQFDLVDFARADRQFRQEASREVELLHGEDA